MTLAARVSLADDVYGRLKDDVANFRLVPGDRFTENELCERMGVSRTPVRQALTRLQQEGYVEVLFRSGWRVLPFNFEQFEQLYDLRMVLETTAVERLCGGLSPRVLDELSSVWCVPPSERSHDAEQVARWDEDFHCTLVAAAGNAEMARVHREVTERIRILRRLDFTQTPRIEATFDEHARILEAIRGLSTEAAIAQLRAHIQTSQAEVRKITLHQLHQARRDSFPA